MKITINWSNLSSIIQTLVGVLTLVISIFALGISIKALRLTNEQFIENSESSNKQFRINLENSTKQLSLIDKMLQEYVYSGRPTITVGKIHIKDTDKFIGELFSPIIEIPIKNWGKRPCYELNSVCKAFSLNSNDISLGEHYSANNLESGSTNIDVFRPKLEKKYKDDFYLYYEITYKDLSLNQRFVQKYYFHYTKLRSSLDFLECTEKEKLKIEEHLNK